MSPSNYENGDPFIRDNWLALIALIVAVIALIKAVN